jgi:hypothetical protein
MTTRELLLREINHAPEDVLEETLRYLQNELKKRGLVQRPAIEQANGPFADYWNQFVGAFAGEEWERPGQGAAEQRESW